MAEIPVSVGLVIESPIRYQMFNKVINSLPDTQESFHVFKIENAFRLVEENKTSVVVVSNKLLSKNGIHLLAKLSQKTKVIICMESDDQQMPATHFAFHAIYCSSVPRFFKFLVVFIMAGGLGHGPLVEKALQQHRIDLRSPSDYGLTKRDIDYLNAYLDGLDKQEIANKLGVSVNTVESAFVKIRARLGFKKMKEFIPFIRTKHWCNLETGELVYF